MLILEKYTIGVGDRFAHQAKAQLQACVQLANDGIDVVPVWNKSNREHSFIGSDPQSVYDAAKVAVEELGWHKGFDALRKAKKFLHRLHMGLLQ